MNDTDKRFNVALDLVQWLDQRIAAQVAHQLEQRLAQERERISADHIVMSHLALQGTHHRRRRLARIFDVRSVNARPRLFPRLLWPTRFNALPLGRA